MTGPEHLLEAERLVKSCTDAEHGCIDPSAANALAAAQVHATLALAAAVALPVVMGECGSNWRQISTRWAAVTA